MKAMVLSICLLATLLLTACESEKQQHRSLSAEYKELGETLNKLRVDTERLVHEQQSNWHRSAKERFGYLYDFSKDAGRPLEYEKNIESVQFKENGKRSYLAMVKMRPADQAIKPNFILHLYNRKGLIIGSACKLQNFWTILNRKIPKGALRIIKCEIKLLEDAEPRYFRIDHPNE